MRKRTLVGGILILLLAGCSPKDPPTYTPVYHSGLPTNRSSRNSWELNSEPLYTQPGVNSGKPVTLKPIPSQAGREPNGALADRVYAALTADSSIPAKYLSISAKDGVVYLQGTVETAAQKARAEKIARNVHGVRKLHSDLRVMSAPT